MKTHMAALWIAVWILVGIIVEAVAGWLETNELFLFFSAPATVGLIGAFLLDRYPGTLRPWAMVVLALMAAVPVVGCLCALAGMHVGIAYHGDQVPFFSVKGITLCLFLLVGVVPPLVWLYLDHPESPHDDPSGTEAA